MIKNVRFPIGKKPKTSLFEMLILFIFFRFILLPLKTKKKYNYKHSTSINLIVHNIIEQRVKTRTTSLQINKAYSVIVKKELFINISNPTLIFKAIHYNLYTSKLLYEHFTPAF